ncbi:AtuA-related protein [Brevibacterium aurantiacum]|uniref:AtuA-like ferredoxin-fold domain-containing protein n=1 Tax=Brevibacterium aurantiacum TaxID=273384 RepID=A0A2A3ZKD4_BREAU|nr:hypothetical protein [Brevibacterium aurantiacum]PCC51953.1 hypothetical protein CIK62_00540 [Brevibacterium aurantiacum]
MTQVDELASVRTGDKGDTLILAVIAHDQAAFDLLNQELSVERVAAHFGLYTQAVTRSELPTLHSFSFELSGLLGGGVTGSPNLDGHGKTMSYHLLTLEI